ncbi:hypothetical protein ACTJJ4_07610 [Microbacterium sp. 22195]|uniref:hypothetical protein n=1 Tax=Microbacterium sp. 22195 TaxID=3453891 RepID=UPI003F842578
MGDHEAMSVTVRRVIQVLLDVQMAFDPEMPDEASESAIDIVTMDLMSIPGAIELRQQPDGRVIPDYTGLLTGVHLLVQRLVDELSTATETPREVVLSDTRGWIDRLLDQ